MTDKENIRAYIEKLHKEHRGSEGDSIFRRALRTVLFYIDSMQEEPVAPKLLEDMLNAKTAAESLGISQEEHDRIVDELIYGKEPELVDVDDLPNKEEEPVSKQNLSNVERTTKNWKEPVSDELEKACEQLAENARKHKAETSSPFFSQTDYKQGVIDGAKWQKKHLWKPADGDDLPEIDREVIALLDNGKVVFAHRPPEFWDGKNIVTGKVTRHYPKTYDKGGWNIPNIKCWLDCSLPNIKED